MNKSNVRAPQIFSPIDFCNNIFLITLCAIQIIFVGLFALTKYPDNPYGLPDVMQNYSFIPETSSNHQPFIDINVFMLLGFGFVFSYLRFHRWMSLSLTFFVAAITIQIYLLFGAFWNKACNTGWKDNETITMNTLIACLKAAVAVLISLGGLIGKVDMFQVLVLALCEMLFYSLNEAILFYRIQIRDMGGAIYIHLFAGLFGVITTWIYSPKSNCKENPNQIGNYGTTTVSFLGTFLLWCLFPTFNSINPKHETKFFNNRFLSIINTFWALTSSTVITYWLTILFKGGKICNEIVQNSSLSGAIIIAACCDMFSYPFPALILGAIAGAFSTASHLFLSEFLERMLIYETKGILHLHVIPGFLGAIFSSIAVAFLEQNSYGSGTLVDSQLLFNRSVYSQGGFQFLGLLVTLAFSAIGGAICGILLRIWRLYDLPLDTFGDHIWFKMINSDKIPSNSKPNINMNTPEILANNIIPPPLTSHQIILGSKN